MGISMSDKLKLLPMPESCPYQERLRTVAAAYGQSKDLALLEENLFLIREFLDNFSDFYSGQQAAVKTDELLFWVTFLAEELQE